METLSRFALARAKAVVALTVVAVLAGGAAALALFPRLTEQNEYPGLPAYEANTAIHEHVGTGGYERPFVPVITLPPSSDARDPATRSALAEGFAAVEREASARVAAYPNTGDERFVSDDGRTTYAIVFGPRVEQGGMPGSAVGEGAVLDREIADILRRQLPTGTQVEVTGIDTLATGTDTGGLNVPVKLAVTVLAALVVLAWVFRSSLAAVPLLISFIAIPVSFIGLLVLTPFTSIHETTMQMVPLLGVGIAVDYALILVTRWREERAHGARGDEAVHRAMASAGKAILFSAGAVGVGLLTMLVLPIPLMRSLAIGGVIVTAFSAVAALTVLPVLLAAVGRRLDRRAGAVAAPGQPSRLDAREENASRAWTAWARTVVRHRWVAATLAVGALVGLGVVALGINLNTPVSDNLSQTGPGRAALESLESTGASSGVLSSFDVLVPEVSQAAAVAEEVGGLPGVASVLSPDEPAWRADGAAVLTVVPEDEGGTEAGRRTIEAVIDAVPDDVLVGGNVTQQMDYLRAAYGAFPWVLVLLSLVTFVMLARAFRSLLLPLKAIVLNLLSLGAVLGAMVMLWQWGWGTQTLLGLQPDGTVGTFVPLTIFAFLFGLTMDYEVFILSRMREEYDRTGSTTEAVVRGIGRTGRLVSCAALILFFSFASMTTGGELDVAVFASGMALGLLIDATVIRCVLVPATVAMMGRWNWWLPAWAARLLLVPASPVAAEDASAPALGPERRRSETTGARA